MDTDSITLLALLTFALTLCPRTGGSGCPLNYVPREDGMCYFDTGKAKDKREHTVDFSVSSPFKASRIHGSMAEPIAKPMAEASCLTSDHP